MDLQNSHFRYTAVLKNDPRLNLPAVELFPTLDELSLQSRPFSTYTECVKSCRKMFEDIVNTANGADPEKPFKVGSEVNPVHTGTPTASTTWGDLEVARLWLFERSQESTGKIVALCRGSIQAIPKVQASVPN